MSPPRLAGDLLDTLGPVGLGWHPDGRATYRGPLLELLDRCDRAFRAMAGLCGAAEERHPVAISAAALDRAGYLDSFPHLATFTVSLDPDDGNLHGFRSGAGPVAPDGEVRLTRLAPTRELLAPAACYHLYAAHAGEALGDAALVLTIRNTCVRREAAYAPLRRQHTFDMREIVCLGRRADVVAVLDRARLLTDRLVAELDLPVTWQPATDAFFRPRQDPKRLFQQLYGTKQEAVHAGDAGDLAIASANLHGDHFGAAFGIVAGGATASSGCIGFGLDRWLFALTDRYGPEPADWPDVPAAAHRAWSD